MVAEATYQVWRGREPLGRGPGQGGQIGKGKSTGERQGRAPVLARELEGVRNGSHEHLASHTEREWGKKMAPASASIPGDALLHTP